MVPSLSGLKAVLRGYRLVFFCVRGFCSISSNGMIPISGSEGLAAGVFFLAAAFAF
jgi:hypothetical protein